MECTPAPEKGNSTSDAQLLAVIETFEGGARKIIDAIFDVALRQKSGVGFGQLAA
jgi:hypothetical protein